MITEPIYKTDAQNAAADFTCAICAKENRSIYAHCWQCRNSGTLHAEDLTLVPAISPTQVLSERVIKILEHYEPGQFEKIEAAKTALNFAETMNGTLHSLVAREEKLVRLAIGNPAAFGEVEASKLRALRSAIVMKWNALEARRRLAEMPVRKVFTNVYEVGGKIADLEVGECACDASFVNQEICEHLLKAKDVKSNGY
jgi:hypothetical protein